MTKKTKLNKKAKKAIGKLEESGKGDKKKVKELEEGKNKRAETEEKPVENKTEGKMKVEKKDSDKKDESEKKDGKDEKRVQEKSEKKNFAVVNASNIPISTKHSKAICKFIKGKKVENAISNLEQVLVLKKAVPMKGEIAHRKGKGMMSGRFPKKASENFIKLLKSLLANSINNEIESPVIVEAVSNIGSRPYGRFGRTRMKRTHIKITAKNTGNRGKQGKK